MSIRRKEIQKLKIGQYLMVDNEPCIIKSIDRSQPGKHGHAKLRVNCMGLFDKNKRLLTIPSGHPCDVPEIVKSNAQINFIDENQINVMNLETYESIDVEWPEDEVLIENLEKLQSDEVLMATSRLEIWEIAGKIFINRIMKG